MLDSGSERVLHVNAFRMYPNYCTQSSFGFGAVSHILQLQDCSNLAWGAALLIQFLYVHLNPSREIIIYILTILT